MKVLVTGASGFLGGRIAAALIAAGRSAARLDPRCGFVRLDWLAPSAPGVPPAVLHEVDVVVNAAGVFRPPAGVGREEGYARIHADGPSRLFDAAVAAGVARVIQISALGAATDAPTAFLRSKAAADDHLLTLPVAGVVLQPSLVFGPEGESARMMLSWAASPLLLVLPGGGTQALQPVHVDDLVALVVRLAERTGRARPEGRLAVVGPEPTTLRGYLQALRRQLGVRDAAVLAVPRAAVGPALRLAARLPGQWLDADAWRMLEHGSVADVEPMRVALGRAPRPVAAFVRPGEAAELRQLALAPLLLALLRASLAAVWLWTALVSFGLYPVEESLVLLARAGVPLPLRAAALHAAASLDLVLGLLCLLPLPRRRRRGLWALQTALILAYTLVITLKLPEFWFHPYGPMVKNLPILAILAALWWLDAPQRGPAAH